MRVSCFGSGQEAPSELYKEMELVGKLLSLRGVAIATGAFGGIGMQAPPAGAASTGIGTPVVGYTYGSMPPNTFLTERVDCRTLAAGIPFDAEYCVRLAGLLSSDAFIVAGGGGPGTFLELVAAINFNQKFWDPLKRIAILEIRERGGWDYSIMDALKAWGILKERVSNSIRVVSHAEAAVRWVCDGI